MQELQLQVGQSIDIYVIDNDFLDFGFPIGSFRPEYGKREEGYSPKIYLNEKFQPTMFNYKSMLSCREAEVRLVGRMIVKSLK